MNSIRLGCWSYIESVSLWIERIETENGNSKRRVIADLIAGYFSRIGSHNDDPSSRRYMRDHCGFIGKILSVVGDHSIINYSCIASDFRRIVRKNKNQNPGCVIASSIVGNKRVY